VNDVSNNCLVRATREGLTEIVECLLEAGADPNCPDEVTFSPAFSRYHCDLIDFVASEVLDFQHQQNIICDTGVARLYNIMSCSV
jgi:hypothetical protein